jgi:four helix bundle protein
MDFADHCYTIAAAFPAFERYGIASQLQRSASSIPANIAEGYGRRHRGDYLRHLSIASGSLAESETHLLLALRRNYLNNAMLDPVWELAQEIGKMLRQQMDSLAKMETQTAPEQTTHPQRKSRSSFHTLDPRP